MTEINVKVEETPAGWRCKVTVREGNTESEHIVSLNPEDYDRIRNGKDIEVDMLVKKTFEFLLEREPKESILTEFNLADVENYYPDYYDEIRKRLG